MYINFNKNRKMNYEEQFKSETLFDANEDNQMQKKVYNESYVEWLESLNSYYNLETRVLMWAENKGILEKAKPINQGLKTLEEVNELLTGIVTDDREEIKDAFGDILVTIIIGAELQGLNLLDCLESVLNIIEKRTGKMINGQFVKDK